jgi:hypothetical protein
VVGASASREGRRRRVTARDGRRSPEGECAIVEPSRGGALSRDPERVNPRVGASECRVPFPDSDEVGSDDGGPR